MYVVAWELLYVYANRKGIWVHDLQGRRNVSNTRGAEPHEAPPWLAPSEKKKLILEPLDCRKRHFKSICKEKIFNQRKNI